MTYKTISAAALIASTLALGSFAPVPSMRL